MELKLVRDTFHADTTLGKMYVNGEYYCETLEDAVRSKKVKGETAIPYGRYGVAFTMSPRFKTKLPLLLNVPNYEGVRIHAGNTHADTEGCILLGKTRGGKAIGESRSAMTKFLMFFTSLEKGEKVFIDIVR